MSNLTQDQWVEQLSNDDNARVIDVRTEKEYASGKIPRSINIDIYKGQGFIDEIAQLEKTKNYYVYCRSGARSAKACDLMNQLGIESVYNLEGGILQWQGKIEN